MVWGAEGAPGTIPTFEAVIESVGIKYTMFDGNGRPLRPAHSGEVGAPLRTDRAEWGDVLLHNRSRRHNKVTVASLIRRSDTLWVTLRQARLLLRSSRCCVRSCCSS